MRRGILMREGSPGKMPTNDIAIIDYTVPKRTSPFAFLSMTTTISLNNHWPHRTIDTSLPQKINAGWCQYYDSAIKPPSFASFFYTTITFTYNINTPLPA